MDGPEKIDRQLTSNEGKGEGGVGGCVMKIFKSLMGALGKIIVTQPKST